MKSKIINTLIILICIISLIEIFINKLLIFNTISYSLNIWLNSLIPSLFPIFVISEILINYNITNYIPKPIKRLFTNLFNTNENIITLFFLSMISGFPSAARNIKQMYNKNKITKEEASHALIFTHFSNPIFILTTISITFFHNKSLGLIILLSHYLPNLLLGIITRSNNYNIKNNNIEKKESNNFPKIMINAIKNSIDTLLLILGTLTSFLIISSLIINKLNLNIYNQVLIKCLLEITMGLKSLSQLNIPNIYKAIISSMTLSFGSLSIHMQILSFLIDDNIPYKEFFIARIYHSILSGLLAFILYQIII